MRGGKIAIIRHIMPADEPLMIAFHQSLSLDTVYARYFEVFKLTERIKHERLVRICAPDPACEAVLVVEVQDAEIQKIVGVGRLVRTGVDEAEFAIVISDDWQKNGLGTELLRRLIHLAREWGLVRIGANILGSNLEMQRLCARQGMTIDFGSDSDLARAELTL